MENNNKPKIDKISWFGIDGALILVWFIVVALILYAFTAHNDFLIRWFFPALLFVTTTLIFIDYCTRVGSFIKISRSKADIRKEKIKEIEELEKDIEE